MVRAATLGMIDFSEFDPWDRWWWRKTRWVLRELEREQTREVLMTQHNHWITLASHSNLTEESFDNVQTNAKAALNRLLKATYPWLADQIGEEGLQTQRDQAISDYRERFGVPGEARYDEMVKKLKKVLQHKLSPMEKKLLRKKREQRWRAQKLREKQGA